MKNALLLKSGDARATLLPHIGGTVGSFSWKGKEVFRPTPADATDALQTANFPLVPFCNRIPGGVFVYDGLTVQLAPNLLPQKHPLHGQGWRAEWTVEEAGETRAVLSYDHAADEWPWSYRAVHTVTLTGNALHQEIAVTNTSGGVMPAGLGFHPYFHAPEGARLQAHIEGYYEIDDEVLPTVHRTGWHGADWSAGASIALPEVIDHAYTGWDQRAVVSYPGVTSTMTAPAHARWLHLYIPPDEGYLCVEPVTNRPNPFGGEDSGIVALQPGETLSTWMQVDVAAD